MTECKLTEAEQLVIDAYEAARKGDLERFMTLMKTVQQVARRPLAETPGPRSVIVIELCG